jgi:hypothetical protein
MKWIKCSEKLPQCDEPVFVRYDDRQGLYVAARYYVGIDEGWHWIIPASGGSDLLDWKDFEADDDYDFYEWCEIPRELRGE